MQPSLAYWLSRGMVALGVGALVSTASTNTHVSAQEPGVVKDKYDRTHNFVVNSSDIADLISSWLIVNEADRCIADNATDDDLNGDGCLDVADIQQLAANVGSVTNPNAPILKVAPNATLEEKTFVVNTDRAGKPGSNGINDTNPGDGACRTSMGDCTFQAAAQEANARPGPDRIVFNVSVNGDPCPDVVSIRPNVGKVSDIENWIQLDDPMGGTTIDGYTQCGAQKNSLDNGSNAIIKIEIDGSVGSGMNWAGEGVNGIEIKTSNNIVRGLALHSWDRQIELENGTATNNHIEGNIIGSKTDESLGQRKGPTHHREGVRIQFGASYNIVGCGSYSADTFVSCTKAQINAARNIISGNGNDGVHLEGSPVTYNRIIGNLIGLKRDGETALANRTDAVDFENGVQNNWLGGESPSERNIISGNGSEGIEISHTITTQYNRVVGNYFGLNANGTKAIRNCGSGIGFEDTPNRNYAYNNVVAGNYGSGVRIYRRSTYNEVYNNRIGVGVNGASLPNGLPDSSCEQADYGNSGVYITGGGQNNSIHNNIIANHPNYGIDVTVYTVESGDVEQYGDTLPTNQNTISQNSIYNNGLKGIRLKTGKNTKTGITYIANQGLDAPTLVAASTGLVSGKACASCKIELFIADTKSTSAAGEGKTFVGEGTADESGSFIIPITKAKVGDVLTATATDPTGNTSEFSTNIAVKNVDVGATATVIAATVQAEATATAAVQQTATVQAGNATATVVAATAAVEATAVAQATATAARATSVAQTTTAIAIETQPALGITATAIAVTQTAAAAPPGGCTNAHCVSLPLVQR